MNQKIITISLGMLMIAPILFGFLPNASAGDTHVWDGGGSGNLLTEAANWVSNIAPAAFGDSITFDATSSKDCTINADFDFVDFTITTGYYGTITIASSFGIENGGFYQAGGTVVTSASYYFICMGNFEKTNGTFGASESTKLYMYGDYSYYSNNFIAFNTFSIISGTRTIEIGSFPPYTTNVFVVDIGATLTISTGTGNIGLYSRISFWSGYSYTNLGTINGDGLIDFFFIAGEGSGYPSTINFGDISCEVYIRNTGASGIDRIVNMGSNTDLSGKLTIQSSNTVKITVNTQMIDLTPSSLIVGSYGELDINENIITIDGTFDYYNGTIISDSSSVRLTGITGYLKGSTDRLNNLFVDSGSTYTMLSNIYCQNYWENATLNRNGYTLYINNDQSPDFTNSAESTVIKWSDSYYYNATWYDQENETCTFSLATDLTGISINSSTGVIIWTRIENPVGEYYITIAMTDGNNTTYQTFNIYILGAISTEGFYVYLMFQLILLGIVLIGYFRIPFLLFIGIIATIILAVPTIQAFDDYYYFGFILILTNLMTSAFGIFRLRKHD